MKILGKKHPGASLPCNASQRKVKIVVVLSTHVLEVSLYGVGTVLLVDKGAWASPSQLRLTAD